MRYIISVSFINSVGIWEQPFKSYQEVEEFKKLIDDTVRTAILTDTVTNKQELLK